MSALRRNRRRAYKVGRVLGDVDAVLHPSKAPKRIANKITGRKIVRRMWLR